MNCHYADTTELMPVDDLRLIRKSSCKLISWKQTPNSELQVSIDYHDCVIFHVLF